MNYTRLAMQSDVPPGVEPDSGVWPDLNQVVAGSVIEVGYVIVRK